MALEFVGQYLQAETFKRTDIAERDVFGRSSFNRYYYAAFLEARKALIIFKPEWGELGHANIPDVLRNTIATQFRNAKLKATKIDDKEGIRACSMAITAAKELADLLQTSYATRVVADYRIETPIVFQNSAKYSLNEVPIEVARQWPSRARSFAHSLFLAERQAHVFS